MNRYELFWWTSKKRKGGTDVRHRVVVVQNDTVQTPDVQVCVVSSKKLPLVHTGKGMGVVGVVDPQPGIPDRSYFYVNDMLNVPRKELAKDPVRDDSGRAVALSLANQSALDLAIAHFYGLPPVAPPLPG